LSRVISNTHKKIQWRKSFIFLSFSLNFSLLRFSFSPISQGYKIGTSIGTSPKIPGILNFIKEILVKNMGEEGGLCNAF
jgi:hypothetical protein